jgi:TolB protein
MNLRSFFFISALSTLLICRPAQTAVPKWAYDATQIGTFPVVPIALSGYSGEAASTLKNDLEVMGFELTTPDKADFTLSGKNNPTVEGRLQKTLSKETMLAKAYTGETIRLQAHALADDVVQAIFGTKGIARTKIAYRHEKSQGNSEIFIADYDGYNPKQVTSDSSLAVSPVWVPKSWHLFYTSYRSGFPWIYSHNLTGGERRPFAKFPGLNSGAVVSPDGKRVAMILSKAGSPDLWVCNIDGTNLRQLTKTREDESSPCWSSDGETICYAARPNERRGLYLISANGGAPRRLDTGGEPNPSEPDWSPDGNFIVFTSQAGRYFSICIVSPQSGNVQKLVEGEDPSWAPNSRTVIFTRRVGKGNDEKRVLSLLDVPTKRVKDTPQISGSRSQPSWAK